MNNKKNQGAKLLGCYCEGLCTHPQYRGAQANTQGICTPKEFLNLLKRFPNVIKIITLAPEYSNCKEFDIIAQEFEIIKAIGHSSATYEEAEHFMKNCDYKYTTHLYNRMTWMQKNEPGLVGASLLNDDVYVEIIPDFIHSRPEYVRLAIKAKPIEKIIFVTDSYKYAGTNFTGNTSFLGLDILINEKAAFLKNGNLAASLLTFDKIIKNIKSIDTISLDKLISTITLNPATVLGIGDKKGLIQRNYDADIVIMNNDFDILCTICDGNIQFNNIKGISIYENEKSNSDNRY